MPLLGSRGVASAKGYGFTVGASGLLPISDYFGDEYNNLSAPIVFSTTVNSTFSGSAPTVQEGLQFFIDRSRSRMYAGYSTGSFYSMTASSGSVYTGNANYYLNSSRSDLSGEGAAGLAGGGRGCTVAYLTGGSRTAVICIGHTSDYNIYFFRASDTAFLGKMSVSSFGMAGADIRALGWDGNYLCVGNSNDSILYRTLLPTSITDGGSLTKFDQFTTPFSFFYTGIFWTGNSYIAGSTGSSGQRMSEFVKTGGSYTLIGAIDKFDFGQSCYSAAIDYKSKVLVMGGYANGTYRTFVGT